MNISDDEPTKNIPEKQEPPAQLEENIMDGKNFEDIDSPDEVTLIQCLGILGISRYCTRACRF